MITKEKNNALTFIHLFYIEIEQFIFHAKVNRIMKKIFELKSKFLKKKKKQKLILMND